MGVGAIRNHPCPCGSGKKYKHCCIDKPDDPDMYEFGKGAEIFRTTYKESRIKQCLFPDHTECSERIIGAHSIQNNKILARIADNGKVLMPFAKVDNPVSPMTSWGRKEASVFTGFCGHHDKTLFQPIEDADFSGTLEQVFLFVYRCFAREFHRKMEMVKFNQGLFKRKPSLIHMPPDEDLGVGMRLAVHDLEQDKFLFDKALCAKEHDCLTYFVWEFDGSCKFAASGMEAPTYDIDLRKIQDLTDPHTSVGGIYYSVFPQGSKTFCIIAWTKRNDALFAGMQEQLNRLSATERKNYINITLPICSENIAINPSAWDALPQIQKEAFHMLFLGSDALGIITESPSNRLVSPSFDLFATSGRLVIYISLSGGRLLCPSCG